MNPLEDSTWSRAEDSTAPMAVSLDDDDFTTFLDFENTDLGFPVYDASLADAHAYTNDEMQSNSTFDFSQNPAGTISQDRPPFGRSVVDAMSFFPTQNQYQNPIGMMLPDGVYQQPMNIPHTPNSTQMYPTSAQHLQHINSQSQMFHGFHSGKNDANFTPGISPDIGSTAGDSILSHIPEYTVSGSFALSPLTSPAMKPFRKSRTANSSMVASPVALHHDKNVDALSDAERPRKTRKKDQGKTSLPGTPARIRKAPTSAPKRKISLNVKISSNSSTGSASEPLSAADVHSLPPSGKIGIPRSVNTSDTNSISPRPLDEPDMPPPPKPGTPSATPKAGPIQDNTASMKSMNGLPPATPASLMKLQLSQRTRENGELIKTPQSGGTSPTTEGLESGMEFLRLPEALAPPESVDAQSSRLSGQPATLKRSNGSSQSPSSSSLTSPAGPIGKGKVDVKGRGMKKRNSSGSTLVSPALRPKVSPGIKPLLPEGSAFTAGDAQTLYLASRSNYQNLLEGSHLPGVSYPSDLSTNLTSKRTSHKLAEQGRRNRINTALQEMQSLLPPRFCTAAVKDMAIEDEEPPTPTVGATNNSKVPQTPTQSGNSKAATVECAIVYIREVKGQMQDVQSENERLKKELDALKASLASSS